MGVVQSSKWVLNGSPGFEAWPGTELSWRSLFILISGYAKRASAVVRGMDNENYFWDECKHVNTKYV